MRFSVVVHQFTGEIGSRIVREAEFASKAAARREFIRVGRAGLGDPDHVVLLCDGDTVLASKNRRETTLNFTADAF